MLGYRQEFEEPNVGQRPSDSRGVNFLVGVAGFGLYFLLELISWFTERGGVFSIASALLAVRTSPAVLDIDENGLRLPSIILVCLAVWVFCRLFGVALDLSTRAKAVLPILVIIGGGFVLDGEFGESIITHYMVAHGYSRCEAGDWAQGNGKSRVWFADYVLRGVECRKRIETVAEYSPFK